MEFNIGKSNSSDARQCVEEATAKLKDPKLILFFSPMEHFDEYAKLLHEKYPDRITMGVTSIATFNRNGVAKNALQVMGVEKGLRCSADILEDIDKYPIRYAERVKRCVDHVRAFKNTICLEFTTSNHCAEESVLSTLNSVLLEKNIPVFGGTAGNDASGTEKDTKVALNGVVKNNGCVFVIMHSESGPIHIYKENIYTPLNGNILTVTKADGRNRRVMEYNKEPAAKVIARELGISENEIATHLGTNPVGRLIGDQLYVTANNRRDGTDMLYHARMNIGTRVMVMKLDDYKKIIEETKVKIQKEVPKPKFSIMCNCLSRTMLFERTGYLEEYGRQMGTVLGDYVGFSGYGEQRGEQHFNQTMIVAVFE